jgi:hypothetical protein
MSEKIYNGSCFCGAVEVTVTGVPAGMGYCHCASCREWSAGPVNAFTLWKPEQVKITKGEGNLSSYAKSEKSHRKWCKTCGGHVLSDHPTFGLVDVYAAVLREFPFEPGVHIHYGETILRIRDGAPKLKDLPKELGGTGQAVSE